MRGLKCASNGQMHVVKVALYVSAWIEIIKQFPRLGIRTVALYVSAWIEIETSAAGGIALVFREYAKHEIIKKSKHLVQDG